MIFRQPLHVRILSRVVFYSGVFALLWIMNLMQQQDLARYRAEMEEQSQELQGPELVLQGLGFRNP